MTNVADQLDQTITGTEKLFNQVDTSNWGDRPTPGKWSKKEILGHLNDSALNNIQRFVRATYEQDFKHIYHQDDWVKAQHYQDVPVGELSILWVMLNRQVARIIRNYPDERFNVEIDVGKEIPNLKTVRFLITDYIEHLRHHQNQLFDLLP